MGLLSTTYLYFIEFVPFIEKRHLDGNYKFWPDLACSRYAKIEVDYLIAKNIIFVEKDEKSANVPEVLSIEDFWSDLKEKYINFCHYLKYSGSKKYWII